MEQDSHVIKLQDIRSTRKFRGVIDMQAILDERFVAIRIFWLTGIDRYLEEGAASAA